MLVSFTSGVQKIKKFYGGAVIFPFQSLPGDTTKKLQLYRQTRTTHTGYPQTWKKLQAALADILLEITLF